MIRHIVLMKLRAGTSSEERAECLRRMQDLPQHISFAKHYEAGSDELHQKTSWDLAQLVVLDSMQQLEEFANHPAHQAALKFVTPFLDQMAGVDFTLETS